MKGFAMAETLLRISVNQRTHYVAAFLAQWLIAHMAIATSIIRLTVGIFAIVFRHSLPAATIGLVAVYTLGAADLVRWCCCSSFVFSSFPFFLCSPL